MGYYPVNLDITDKSCVVVGGGKVAYRKVRSLLGCSARVTVISPEVVPELTLLAKRNEISLHRRPYEEGDLENAVLAFAATDKPEIQQQVGSEARRRNILLNSADDPERCDFQVPAKVRRGELLITVSTGGGSPAISRMVRMELEEQFGQEYAVLIFLLSSIREELVPGPTTSIENRDIFREILHSNILGLVKGQHWGGVRKVLAEVLPGGMDIDRLIAKVANFAEDEVTA